MTRAPRRYGLMAALVVLVAAATWLGASAWGRARNAAYAARGRSDADTERTRLAALRFPPTSDTVREAACSFDDVHVGYLGKPEWRDVCVVALHPERAITPAVETTVRAARPELEKLSADLRCDRVDPGAVLAMQEPEWATLAGVLLVDGHLELRDGNVERAATRYMASARTCTLTGTISPSAGWFQCQPAFLALARLLATHDDAPLERIDAFLVALEPVLPTSTAFALHFRLSLAELAETAHLEVVTPLSAPKYWNIVGRRRTQMRAYGTFVPQALRFAQATDELDRIYRRIETLAPARSPERIELVRDVDTLMRTTTNPFVYDLLDAAGLALRDDELLGLAAYRLARTVAEVERTRRSGISVLAVLPDQPWTRDPATPGDAFHYDLDVGYRLWSVGKDGLDQQGLGDDLLIERTSLKK